jgi:glycosyltransferase involved in cell wall biosynthesis
MKRHRTVFLACPYGQVGGGMGSIMQYLASLGTDPSGRFDLKRLESRGGGPLWLSPLFLAGAVGRILAEAARGRLAVVHLNLAERGSVYRKATLLFAARLVGARVLLHLHAAQIVGLHATMPRPGRWLLRRMFRSADRVVVLGDLWRRWSIETFGLPASAVTVLRNGVPASVEPREPRQPAAPFRLLFLGNLLQRKGIADLLHALADLPGAPVALTVAGGGAVETYRRMAANLGIADRVHFTGWVDQASVRTLLAAADALALPAYDEGLPLVILEAMATGVPVICTPVGAIPEVFAHGETAWFVPPGDRPALTSAIVALRDNPALCARLAAEGLALYRRDFTMDVFASRISALYAALDRPRPRSLDLRPLAEAGDDR